ncbi:MAG: hypothetical protein U0793_12820 [Gemmataceae bacterium]
MAAERPGTVTAAGVLCIIYGSVGVLCGICGVIGLVMQASGVTSSRAAMRLQARARSRNGSGMRAEVPPTRPCSYTRHLPVHRADRAADQRHRSVRRLRPWARTLTLIFVWFGIALYLFQTVWMLAFIFPALNNVFGDAHHARGSRRLPGALPKNATKPLRGVMTLISVVTVIRYGVVIAYLATILIRLAGAHRMAFAGIGPGRVDDDEGWRERRPERRDDADDWREPPRPSQGPPPTEGPDDWRYREGR